MVDTLFINGKFAAQRTTGVQRVAQQLLQALDRRLQQGATGLPARVVLLLPVCATTPALQSIETVVLGDRRWPLHLWEQGLLPWAARGGLLVNLAGSAPLLGVRQVCLLHDAAVFDRPEAYSASFVLWYRSLFRQLPRRGATLLTVSAFSRRRLALHLGVAPSSIGVVRSGGAHLASVATDCTVLEQLGLLPGRYFLAVGSINANKNFGALLAAFSGLNVSHGARLVIVGDADRRVFSGPGSAKSPGPEAAAGVLHAGPLADPMLKALYEHAAGLVFPSIYEGFGLPPLEAMSCGCPVLASNAAAIPEVCGEAALYFDPTSVSQIRAAMQRLLDEPELRERLVSAGVQRLQAFGWDQAGADLHRHLETASIGVVGAR